MPVSITQMLPVVYFRCPMFQCLHLYWLNISVQMTPSFSQNGSEYVFSLSGSINLIIMSQTNLITNHYYCGVERCGCEWIGLFDVFATTKIIKNVDDEYQEESREFGKRKEILKWRRIKIMSHFRLDEGIITYLSLSSVLSITWGIQLF